jgi:iron complex outermembrane receptor protein
VNHYKSGYVDQDGVSLVGAYSTWDLYGTWMPTKSITLTAGVKNLFDTAPPKSGQAATFQVGYDPRFADSLLRAYYVRAQYKF